MSAPIIAVHGVTKTFGQGETAVPVLHGIDLEIAAGELTYVIGESGSGKTTLISIMTGILNPSAGSVSVMGTDLYALTDTELVNFRLHNLGFIFQQYNLLPALTAAENAAVTLIAAGVPRGRAVRQAAEQLETLGLTGKAGRLPRQLSGGQQQRVAIARALVHGPKVVVCDEPTAALDATSGRRVMESLRAVALQPDRAVVIVTHDNRIFPLADRIIALEDGRVVSDGRQAAPHDQGTHE